MHFLLKLALANAVIAAAALAGRRAPTLAGLIATMPLTTLIVMVWLHSEAPSDRGRMVDYTRGVLWGVLPSVAFFLAALLCLRRGMPFPVVLGASSAVWLAGAALHRWLVS